MMFIENSRTKSAQGLSLEEYGQCAWHSARLEIDRGTKKYGETGSWETWGTNEGELVQEYQESVGCSPGNAWCGAFVGYNYLRAGFDGDTRISSTLTPDEKAEPRKMIFMSAYRLKQYLLGVGRSHVELRTSGLKTRSDCEKWLDSTLAPFGPRAGDIVLMHTSNGDYTHVGMVGSYDLKTHTLVTYEGNHSDRAGAFRIDLADPTAAGYYRVNMIARFGAEELTEDAVVPPTGPSPDPLVP